MKCQHVDDKKQEIIVESHTKDLRFSLLLMLTSRVCFGTLAHII